MRVVYSQDTHRQGDPEWELWDRYDLFYGTPLDHSLRVWGIDTLIVCGTVANICVPNICVHYTAASAACAATRW